MFKTEQIESWNETFVNGEIQEADLKHPTEGFLVRILVAYLQKFGYKVEEPPAEAARERRLFLVRLAQNIDHILKFTDKSYTFLYYDLVKPVPKKTSHMLDILLNYYYYYNMFKMDVFGIANERIKTYKEILDKIQSASQENQQRRERAVQIVEEIASLSKKVPATKAQLDDWKTKKTQQEEQYQKEQDAIEDLNKKLIDLRANEQNLKKQIVEDNEGLKLKSELSDLQTNIEERLSIKRDLETTLHERMEVIKDLESLLKHLEEAKKIFPSALLDNYKELTKKLKKIKLQHEKISRKKLMLLATIDKQESELKALEEKFKNKRQQFEQEKAKICTIINEEEVQCISKQQELKILDNQLQRENNLLEEGRQIRLFLEEATRKILSRYTTTG